MIILISPVLSESVWRLSYGPNDLGIVV